MLSSQILIPSKPFSFSPLNPNHSKTLIQFPLHLPNLKTLASTKGKNPLHENSKQHPFHEKNGEEIFHNSIPNSQHHQNPPPNPKTPNPNDPIPFLKPRKKKRRGRPSEAQYTEDYIRDQLTQTLASIRSQNPELYQQKLKEFQSKTLHNSNSSSNQESESESDSDSDSDSEKEDPDWPLDADIGWGISATEYFEKHPIKNVVDDNGVEIDWEGEVDKGWVKEINCLEWESFAFHPSPLVVLVFERYERPADNWRFLSELEKAAKVYWGSKDHLPPRTVKLDVNIERDLAYALKVKETDCPQLLFLKGNYVLYREKEIRSSDEIVKMIAHFYYNAKRPDWIDSAKVKSF